MYKAWSRNTAILDLGLKRRHLGVLLTVQQWHELAGRLQASRTDFIIEPYIRFKGEPGEQATLFFLDPSGNAIEFKAFEPIENLFAK